MVRYYQEHMKTNTYMYIYIYIFNLTYILFGWVFIQGMVYEKKKKVLLEQKKDIIMKQTALCGK